MDWNGLYALEIILFEDVHDDTLESYPLQLCL